MLDSHIREVMNLTKTQLILVGIIVFIVLFFILGALGIIPIFKPSGPDNNQGSQVALSFWGIDDQNLARTLIENYTKGKQGITINYKQISPENYGKELLNAMAIGKSPDIIMFHRSWLPKNGDKIYPVDQNKFSIVALRQLFPDAVEKDFSYNQNIYALPLYFDNLALFYNKDIFNSKGASLTPQTWNDFKNLVQFFTEFDLSRKIKKPAAAIGGNSKTIEVAPDLLMLLMIQLKSAFIDPVTHRAGVDPQAQSALNFYLQFANSASPYYTWDENLGNSIDLFAAGKVAMIFDYAKKIPYIKQKNPFLNFAVIPMPQFNTSEPKNYADYWGLAVSNQSKNKDFAWDFIINATTNQTISSAYLKASGLPPALRTLIAQYQNNPDLNVFAKQSLSSASVYQADNELFSQIISKAIENSLSGKLDPQKALNQAVAEINNTLK